MDEEYEGNVEATGEDYSVEPAESRRPFRALQDAGLLRTTTGNRVFGALKGALDGDLTYPTVIRGLLDLTRKTSNLTLKCIGITYMEAMLLPT